MNSGASDRTRSGNFTAAREFIYREGRLLDQRRFATLFEGASPRGVLDALRGYRNANGGFGNGLEPDKRCPDSQPLDVELALQIMDEAGAIDGEMTHGAIDFLATVTGPTGGVPPLLPSIAVYPHAQHWGDGNFPPALVPTAGIVGLLCKLGLEHPWIGPATQFCWTELARELPSDAHSLGEALIFLAHVPERERAEALIPAVTAQLASAALYRADPAGQEYGLTPLHFAPAPDSRWRGLFPDELIAAHLDRLRADQQPDGGWPLSWQPPSVASTLEWRGHVTVQALTTLAAFGRL